jgi:hypothetical protein
MLAVGLMVLIPGVALAAVAIKRAGPSDAFPPRVAAGGVFTIPNSALIPSTTLYTDSIGGGIGNIAVMTDGGNAPGVGDPSGRNDDGFVGPLNLGFTLNFIGNNYTQFWANNNGNISFTGGIPAYTPLGPQGAIEPVISPFFGDVDTRNPGSGVMHLRTDIPNEIIVTWSQVGYFDSNADKLNNFQLVLRGPGYPVPAGEGQIGFFYTNMQWEVGDASGGSGGFCPAGTAGSDCVPAAVGFGDGLNNGLILAASQLANVSATVSNHHIWFNLVGGIPTPILPSSSDCLFNWAERNYANLFAPAGAVSTTLAPYYYRYYPQTNAYLATSSTDNHVDYLGPLSNYSILDVGALSGWLATAGCQ